MMTEDEMLGWRHQLDAHESGKLWALVMNRRPGVLQSMGSQSRTRLSGWTELKTSDIMLHRHCDKIVTEDRNTEHDAPSDQSTVAVFLQTQWKSLSRVHLFVQRSPWTSPGHNTAMGSLAFLRGLSQPRDWNQVSHIAGRFLTSWATREAHVVSTQGSRY